MAQLAINGGDKTIRGALGAPWPVWDQHEEKALLDTLHSGVWWRGGHKDPAQSKVAQFEDAFARYQDAKHCIAVTNGTQALECALKAVGVGAGDDVLVPALTFVASATAIALVNATPVFVDIDPETYNIDPDAMAAAITPKTKAAVVVHNGGYPADMDRILALSASHDLRIVEDCAHAHGSEWDGKRVGALGDFGTFSFQMGKTLTAGEGGAVLTNDPMLAEMAYSFHHIGRIPGRPFYEFHRLASNLRMTEWQGAILSCQLERLDEQLKHREANAMRLAEGLAEVEGVDPIARDPRVTRWGFYYLNLHFRPEQFARITRDMFIKAATAEGVPVRVGAHGKPIYRNPVFQNCGGIMPDYTDVFCEQAERVSEAQSLSLPHATFLGPPADMDLIVEAFAKIRRNVDELEKLREA